MGLSIRHGVHWRIKQITLDSKEAKQFNKKITKDMRTKLRNPGDLLNKSQATSKKPTKKTLGVLGLV